MKKNVYESVVGAGVDVHYKFSKVAFIDSHGRVVRRERLDHVDREALQQQLSQWPRGLTAVLEASFGWGWLSDLMEDCGIQVRLANCFKVDKMREALGVPKTNDKDAALLAPLPMEMRNWWEVWRAPLDVRERREWMRHRMDLVVVQTATKGRIHAIFHRHGVFHEYSDLFGGRGRRFLGALCAGKDAQSGRIPAGAMEALKDDLALLLHLRADLARIAGVLRRELERTPAAGWIMSVPGFGLILSHVVLAEIGDLRRFRRARSLASYSLLAPRSKDTGEPLEAGQAPLGRRLGRRGNRVLKWAFIEAAHGAVRHGGRWRELFDRATHNGRRDRGRGYIKVARALVDVVYAVLRDQRVYQERPPQRPQTASSALVDMKAGATRPGTGRLYQSMVAAGK